VKRGILIVGLDNPQSSDPRYALFPHPSGCAGHRLMSMMQEVSEQIRQRDYINIPKSNLFSCGRMPKKNKNGFLLMAATTLTMSMEGSNQKVILLGNEVRNAVLGKKIGESLREMTFVKLLGCQYAWIPHPSGRNQYYNDTRRRRKIGRFLVEVTT
jgi:hypothetical protein